MRIIVLVPAYNEEGNIEAVLKDLAENFPREDILVVNDGSHDKTSRVAQDLGANVIDLPYNLGIGGAMQTGFLYASRMGYDAAIQFDGDGQHKADQIVKLLTIYKANGLDLVVGSRFLSGNGFTSSILRASGVKILSSIVSWAVKKRITDPTSGFRVYGRKAIELFSSFYPEDYPEVESLILAHKRGLKIEEVSAVMGPRIAGKSSITFLEGAYYMVKVLLAISIDLMGRFHRGR